MAYGEALYRIAMRKILIATSLISVLGLLASVTFLIHTEQVRRSKAKALAEASDRLSSAQLNYDMSRETMRLKAENDDLAVRNAEMELEIAENEGKGIAAAEQKLTAARAATNGDDLLRETDETLSILGGPPEISDAVDAQRNAAASLFEANHRMHIIEGVTIAFCAMTFLSLLALIVHRRPVALTQTT